MKVLDTTFLVDLLRGSKNTIKLIDKKEILLTTQINMYEIIRGLFLRKVSSSKFFEITELFENIKVLQLDDNSIIKAAEISSELTDQGQLVSDCDCLIAGIALSKGINEIVTKNTEHFKRIKGIKIVSY